ncbi:MAG: hypothetical protein KIT84_00270 [Labilithrix sp.]|nr:hypothetical protein [Labilithrix sp.]MCW5809417.1 hypothetical protein [Labilithrix sp.]
MADLDGPSVSSQQAAAEEVRPEALKATLTIDGKECADATNENAWLNRAPGDRRWILYLDGPLCDVTVQIGGVNDAPYPQKGVLAFEGQETIKVFAREPASPYLDSFLLSHVSAPGVEGTVLSGPIGDERPHHIVAFGTVSIWEGREESERVGLPETRDVVVNVALP